MRSTLVLVVVAACSEPRPAPAPATKPATPTESTPTCTEIVESVKRVAIETSGATTDEDREYVAKFIESTVVKMREDCETWSPAQRRCAHAARTEHAMLACDRDAAIERGEDLGGPSCEQVADHLTKVSIDPIGPKPDHRAELRERFVTYCQPWPRKQKECVLAATTSDAVTACGPR